MIKELVTKERKAVGINVVMNNIPDLLKKLEATQISLSMTEDREYILISDGPYEGWELTIGHWLVFDEYLHDEPKLYDWDIFNTLYSYNGY